MPFVLVGRERESGALGELVASVAVGSAGLVLEGEAGIGKTTLWHVGCALAQEQGVRVLRARPTQAEAQLSYGALADLLAGSLSAVLPQLPAPQARALEIALRRSDPDGAPVDQHAVAAGFRSALVILAGEAPVIVAIDDVQWLDAPSERVLSFAARRLEGARVGFLVTRRLSASSSLDRALGDGIASDRLLSLLVGAFDLDELHHVIHAHLGRVPPRPMFDRIAETSAGNPLQAVAIARSVLGNERPTLPGAPLRVPESLTAVMTTQVEALPKRTRDALLLCALASAPTVDLIDRAMGRPAERSIALAEEAQVVEIDDLVIRFTHPLLAFVSANAPATRRRPAHRRLAAACSEPEERARHLALSASGPDAEVADALEEAARAASGRGAPDAAAELTTLAISCTPPGESETLEARSLLLGECLLVAGDTGQARTVLEPIAHVARGRLGARALLMLARISWLTESSVAAVALGERALREADGGALEAEIHAELAYLYRHDRELGSDHARRAEAILESLSRPDPRLAARTLFAVVYNDSDLGRPLDRARARRALELDADRPPERVADSIVYGLGCILWSYDEIFRARELLEEALDRATDVGDEGSIPTILDQLSQLEVVAGNWDVADRYAQRQFDVGLRAGQENHRTGALETLASVAAHQGRLDLARVRIDKFLAVVDPIQDPMHAAFGLRTLGFVELSAGNPLAAVDAFTAVDEIAERIGVLSPGILRHDGNHIEALVELGWLEAADLLVDRLDERGRRIGLPSAACIAARSRALVQAARGDLTDAVVESGRATEIAAGLEMPLELGRSYLVAGRIHRRRKEKRLAKEDIEAAKDVFHRLGASVWLDRARAEERRLGLRPSAPQHLTDTETCVAGLAAAGLTNPEIAARLFMSRKTVEFNLGKVYRKLGIRGRTELAVHLAAGDADRSSRRDPNRLVSD